MYNVLIVDDTIADIKGIINFMPWNELNCHVIDTAVNGQEGLEKAVTLQPDIIITDISMPLKNGIEMTKEIKKTIKNTYFIYISCFNDFEFAKSAIDNNVSSYILKPIKISELIASIKRITAKIEENHNKEQLISDLEKQIQENIDTLREKFFIDILISNNFSEQQADFLSINPQSEYRIIIMQIENYNPDNVNDSYLKLFHLNHLCKVILSEQDFCINIDISSIALVLKKSYTIDGLIDLLQNIQKSFYETFKICVSVFLGKERVRLNCLYKEYKQITEFIKQNYLSDSGCLVFSDDISMTNNNIKLDPESIYNELMQIFSSDYNANDFINNYYPVNTRLSIAYAKAVSFYIINAINIILIERNITFSQIFDNELLLWNKLSSFDTIKNTKQWISNIITFIKEYLNNNSNQNKHLFIIDEIKKNISKNYSSFTALEDLIDNLNLSFNYANILFKKHTNQTIFEYLVQIRIKAAKRLLSEGDYKISDIAEMVGYASNTYFTTAFKKYTKLTPTEYKNFSYKKQG